MRQRLHRLHGRVKRVFSATIHRNQERAPLGIHRNIHPAEPMRHCRAQCWCPQVDGEHLAAHEVADDSGLPEPLDSKLAPHRTSRSIRADEVARPHALRGTIPDGANLCVDAGFGFGELFEQTTVANVIRWQRLCMPPQRRFDELLRHAMRKLSGAPRAAQLPDLAHGLRCSG